MSLVLQINPSLEKRMRQDALRKGVELSQFSCTVFRIEFSRRKAQNQSTLQARDCFVARNQRQYTR